MTRVINIVWQVEKLLVSCLMAFVIGGLMLQFAIPFLQLLPNQEAHFYAALIWGFVWGIFMILLFNWSLLWGERNS